MTETIRNRCKVLQAIAARGPCTVKDLEPVIPDLTPQQIQRAAYNLRASDDVRKVGETVRGNGSGRPMLLLEINAEMKDRKKTGPKKGRANYSDTLRKSRGALNGAGLIRFRDRKIKLLTGLARVSGGIEQDLLIGMIHDYGGEWTP